jgi:hypothetical protein
MFKRSFPSLFALNASFTPGLVGYWPVIGAWSNVMDVFTGLSMIAVDPIRATDKAGEASGSLAVNSLNSAWKLPTVIHPYGDYTITEWIRLLSCSPVGPLIYIGLSSSNEIRILFEVYNNRCTLAVNLNQIIGTSTYTSEYKYYYAIPTDGTWVHLAWSVSGTVGNMYVNGNLIISPGVPTSAARDWSFIGSDSGALAVVADFDEIKIYNRSLSQNDITTEYNGGTPLSFVTTIPAA